MRSTWIGLVERDPDSGRYSVAYGAVRLSTATSAASLVRRSRPVLEHLAKETDGTVFLEVASRGALVTLDEARSSSPIQVDLTGVDIPLHCGSVGKLYLASLPAAERAAYLAGPLAATTEHTHTDPVALEAELQDCAGSGIAVNYKEHREEWCGITAAIRDRAGRDLAYVNVTLPTYKWTLEQLRSLTPTMQSAARAIEAAVGAD